MSAFDDFPPATHLTLPQWERHKAMLEEIDRLRLDAGYLDDIARTRGEENEHLRTEADNMRNMLADSIVVHHDDQAEICKLQAQVEVLEVVIARLRCVCDAAFSVVRYDGAEDGWTAWQELVSALEEARYEPLVDCGGVDCERQGAMIVHRPSCVRWEP